jgi:hypothetical protein
MALKKGVIMATITAIAYLAIVVVTTPNLPPEAALRAAFAINSPVIFGISIGVGAQVFISSYGKSMGCRVDKKKKGYFVLLLPLITITLIWLAILLNTSLVPLQLVPSAEASAEVVANTNISTSNVPIGNNVSSSEIINLASLFNDQPFQGGQISPRVAKWVNEDVFIFFQFDKSNASSATDINYVGIGKKGTFCESDRPGPEFVHFHKWNSTSYKEGHGQQAGDEGYLLMWVATGEFDLQGRHVTPGVDLEFSPTPTPPKC